MKRRITFLEDQYEALRSHVLRGSTEEAAVCLGGWIRCDELEAILVREVHTTPPDALIKQSGAFIEIDPGWLASIVKRAREHKLAIVVVHSHPFADTGVRFSSIDVDGQARLIPKLQSRVPGAPHAELVFGQHDIDGLIWSPGHTHPQPIDIVRVAGRTILDHAVRGCRAKREVGEEHDRQVMFLGREGQRRLAELTVGVVGAGGNGSSTGVQLAHLGVGTIISVDPDVVVSSNRNRIIGSTPADDGGIPKVEVLRRYIEAAAAGTQVVAIKGAAEDHWRDLRVCDILIGCTDTLASRWFLARLASQYLIPLIDTGVEIELYDGELRTIAGRVNVVRPGDACLDALAIATTSAACTEVGQNRRPGYVAEDPAASVLPANSLVASLACLEFLKLTHGLLGGSPRDRYFAYSARSGEVRACSVQDAACPDCQSALGIGDAAALPTLEV